MRTVRAVSAFLAALMLLSLTACSRPQSIEVTDPNRQMLELTVENSLVFTPKTLTAPVGQPVAVILRNQDAVLHDWTVSKIAARDIREAGGVHNHAATADRPALHVAADPGKAAKIEFTPAEKGEYLYYCSVPGHKESGMSGTLIVQ